MDDAMATVVRMRSAVQFSFEQIKAWYLRTATHRLRLLAGAVCKTMESFQLTPSMDERVLVQSPAGSRAFVLNSDFV